MSKIFISEGIVIDPEKKERFSADVLLEDGVIAAVGKLNAPADAQVIDARGLYVCPGFIDPHGHIDGHEYTGELSLLQGITTTVGGNCGFSPLDVIRFFDDHSDLEVTFVTEAGRDFVTGLKDGSVDLAIDRLPTEDFAAHQNSFYTCSLVKEKQCVLMSNDDPRAERESISFRELQGATMISGLENSSEDRILKETCRKYGLTLSRVFRSDGIETNMNLVRSGKGVALGPKSFSDF